jgi:hypothetical protein
MDKLKLTGLNLGRYFNSRLGVLENAKLESGSAKANGRKPKSRLVQVFNFKLFCFVKYVLAQHFQALNKME